MGIENAALMLVKSAAENLPQQMQSTLKLGRARLGIGVATDNLHRVAAVGADREDAVTVKDYILQQREYLGNNAPVVIGIGHIGHNTCRLNLGQ